MVHLLMFPHVLPQVENPQIVLAFLALGPLLGAPFVFDKVTLVLNPGLCHLFSECEELKRLLPEMVRFEPTWEELELYKDGGIAIIDQWICSHAR